jgi:hypothetical protein
VKPFVPTIDRADLITEADLDEEPEDDNLDTEASLEDFDVLIDTLKYYDEHEEH